MEYSKNFNFALPSSTNDTDLADINELANNFRKIDENAVKKEQGKGLSTNDFTDAEKQKLEDALLPENIDQKYNPTSPNAQSGVAVASVIDGVANAIKNTASGNPIVIDDASPITHNLDIKTSANETVYVRSKNLIPFDNKSYNNGKYVAGQTYTINGVSFTVNDDGSVYAVGTAINSTVFVLSNSITLGTNPYTLTLSGCPNNIKNYYLALVIDKTSATTYYDYGNGTTIENIVVENDRVSFVITSGATIDATIYPMLEFGNTANEFVAPTESYSETADENGVVDGLVSVAPCMSIFTETGESIECTYNKDTEKALKNYVDEVIGGIENGSY